MRITLSRNPLLLSAALTWTSLSACGAEHDAATEEPTIQETSAVTATDSTRRWHQVTGLLNDIAASVGPGSLWGVDTNSGTDGFRVVKWNGSSWNATPGRGVRIALRGAGGTDANGISRIFRPWVVTSSGQIKRATDATGSTWVPVVGLPNGVLAKDIGGGSGAARFPSATQEIMWAIGRDGKLYMGSGGDDNPGWSTVAGAPSSLIAVSSGPHCIDDRGEIMVLTSGGEAWLSNQNFQFVPVGHRIDIGRNDLSMGTTEVRAQMGYNVGSIMLTSTSSIYLYVSTLFATDAVGGGEWVGTGDWTWLNPTPQPVSGKPIAITSDCDRNRVWMVTDTHRVYYGD